MNYKRMIYGGLMVLTASIIIPILITVFGIYSSFEALRTNETAGIGAVGDGIQIGIVATGFGLIGSVIGIIFIVIGLIKNNRQTKSEN